MKTSPWGQALIKSFETLSLVAYPDPGTGGEPWTNGWGHTGGVKEGDTCTPEEAEAWFVDDVEEAESHVDANLNVELTEQQYDACVSAVYNIGPGGKRRDGIIHLKDGRFSTFWRKLNEADFIGAGVALLAWNKAGGRVMRGLTRRRTAEAVPFHV